MLDSFTSDQLFCLQSNAIAGRSIASAFMSLFLIFGEKGWQFELLQMVLQKKLRFLGGLAHAAAPSKRAA